VRRLTADELVIVGSELGATLIGDIKALTEAQQVDRVLDALGSLLVAIVGQRPFDRRNHAIGLASIDLLAQLNGLTLDLSPPEAVAALIAGIRAGLSTAEVRRWFAHRAEPGWPVIEPSVVGPRCPGCSAPLREALATNRHDHITFAACGCCGQLLGRPVRHRPRQEV
jgi:hypothetical protein